MPPGFLVRDWTAAAGLTLHPTKTRIVDAKEDAFEFLGYRFEGGRRYVRKKSLQAFKDKVRAKTGRTRGDSLDRIIGGLNPMLRGWFAYFRAATPLTFSTLDSFIRRRLRSIPRKQAKRPGRGRTFEDHRRWPNVFFADRGLFTLKAAHESARDSR